MAARQPYLKLIFGVIVEGAQIHVLTTFEVNSNKTSKLSFVLNFDIVTLESR
jgi:hypothetical protein